MSSIGENERCSGCGICSLMCPTKAISLKEDVKGFIRPFVDDSKCIDCNKCIKFCHEYNKRNTNYIHNAYLASSKSKEILEHSSSGGVFSELARVFLDNGGYVCGASLIEPSVGTVKHIVIDNVDDIYKLRKSKYVESSLVDILPACLELVKAGKVLMFVGTPCQCAAIRNFLCDDEKLFVVDFICHGTGSPKVLKWYLSQEKTHIGKIHTLDFRYKNNESGSYFYISGDKGSKLIKNYSEGYPYAFATALIVADDCLNCKYATVERVSDITLADKCDGTGLDFDKSTILANSKRGVQLLESLVIELKQVSIASILENAWHLTSPNEPNLNRDKFFKSYTTLDYTKIYKTYLVMKPMTIWRRAALKLKAIVKQLI